MPFNIIWGDKMLREFPDIIRADYVEGTVTASSVGAGSSSVVSFDIGSNSVAIVVGIKTDTSDASVEFVRIAEDLHTIYVKAINNSDSAQDIVVSYKVLVIKKF